MHHYTHQYIDSYRSQIQGTLMKYMQQERR